MSCGWALKGCGPLAFRGERLLLLDAVMVKL